MAGFEIRDQLAWVFGSGFPKSHDVSKGIDAKLIAGSARTEDIRRIAMGDEYAPSGRGRIDYDNGGGSKMNGAAGRGPITDDARQWQGWGTALKPAYEPIVLCRKPLSEPTVAANVLRWGVGAINIDGCRIEADDGKDRSRPPRTPNEILGGGKGTNLTASSHNAGGRWPANLAHDGSPEVLAGFPITSSGKMKAGTQRAAQDEPGSVCYGTFGGRATDNDTPGDSGSAARFYYCAKASKSDRNEGLDDLPEQPSAASQFRPNHAEGAANGEGGNPYGRWSPVRNNHSTVKPSALMQWLVRLVTPPGGLVLDPFAGSGTTGVACAREGFSFVGCEMTPEYVPIIKGRVGHAYGLTMPSIAAKSARTNGGR